MKADLCLMIQSLSLRSAGSTDTAHFSAYLSLGERSCLQPPCAVIISGDRSCPPAMLLHAILLFNSAGQREKGQAAKYAALQGFVCPRSEHRAAPGQPFP